MEELLVALPTARREPLLIGLLADRREPFGRDHPALGPLRDGAEPWSPTLARAMLAAIARRFARGDQAARSDWHLRAALDHFALVIPHTMAEDAIA